MNDLKIKALALLGSRKFYVALALGVVTFLHSGN